MSHTVNDCSRSRFPGGFTIYIDGDEAIKRLGMHDAVQVYDKIEAWARRRYPHQSVMYGSC